MLHSEAEFKMSKNHRISIGLTDQEFDDLQKIAEAHRVSLAWVGRQAISEFLSAYQENKNPSLLPLREAQKGQ
ncbi:hypothetical protein [Phaeobacter italicus]|uniref:hypothetical protein n=1 Tax=Phaeobacter italicus TaxID=481446 RepID=UPI000669D9FD|nr:hypothetical protein [Phaeobacter italicus]CRL14701.1 hypothetical protein NIT7645_01732 [Phaeobacter italicus]SFH65556.1 hypothetical protein SAMN04488019_1266 [Phaeobacter italicus]